MTILPWPQSINAVIKQAQWLFFRFPKDVNIFSVLNIFLLQFFYQFRIYFFFVVIIFSIWLLIRVCVSFIVTTINTVQAISLQQRSSTKATNDIHIEPRIEPRTTISRYLRFVQLNQSQHGISSARWNLDSYYCNLDIFL